MDQTTIQQIAEEVARHLPSTSWMLLSVQVVLTLLAAGAGAFFGEYTRTRGKNLAIKADLESIKAQLSATTEAVETVKSEISQRDWAKRERANLRRMKLEAILAAMHDCEAYLTRFRSRAMACELPEDRDPSIELSTAIVYLPELRTQVDEYVNVYLEECVALRNLSLDLTTTLQLDAQQRSVARQTIYDPVPGGYVAKIPKDT
jgi:hypothetical protein